MDEFFKPCSNYYPSYTSNLKINFTLRKIRINGMIQYTKFTWKLTFHKILRLMLL